MFLSTLLFLSLPIIAMEDQKIGVAKQALENNPYVLHDACEKGNYRNVQLLIDAGADVDAQTRDEDGYSPLHCAAAKGRVNVVRVLIDHNADVNAQDKYHETPLHQAAELGHDDVVQILLSKVEMSQVLADAPQDLRKYALSFSSSFFSAKAEQEIWDLKHLALMNIMNNLENYDNYTDLINLIETSVVEQYGQILPSMPLDNETINALLCALEEARNKLMAYCIDAQLNFMKEMINKQTKNNKTALDLARKKNQGDVIELLENIQNAQSFDELTQNLQEMIENNIKAKLSFE